MDGIVFDLRLAWRSLIRDRGFTVTAIATLAIAVALNVTVFTVRDAMLFRGLPHAARNDRLVFLALRKTSDPACCPGPIRYADFEVWRTETRSFDGLTFGGPGALISFRASDQRPIDMMVSRRTPSTFSVLGVTPALGRDFVEADALPGASAVAIVSHRFWERRLGRRPDIVGLTVHINDVPASIVGVLPQGFALVMEQDLFMPLMPLPTVDGHAIGRLRDGVTLDEARAELATITQGIQAADPGTVRGLPTVQTYSQAHVSADAPRIYNTLWAGAWFVLLIACANLANLSVVRMIGRWRQFSTRIALGAAPVRLLRQLLIEHVAIAGIAATIAATLVVWGVGRWADATASPYLALDYRITSSTIIYLLAISGFAAIAIAMLPAVRVMRLGADDALKGEARGVTHGIRGKRLAAALITLQMALAIVLLAGAGVLVRSFDKIVNAETGVADPSRVMIGLIGLPSDKYPTPAVRGAFYDRLEAQLRSVAAVETLTFANTFPTRMVRPRPLEIEGRAVAPNDADSVQVLSIGPDYFRAVAGAEISGRDFTARDDAASPRVVVVNESFAKTFLPGEQVIGKRVRLIDANVAGPWRTIVGIAPNVMQGDPTRQHFKPVLYAPFRQQPLPRAYVLLRTSLPPGAMAQATLAAIQAIDPDVITEQFGSLQAKFAFDRDFMDLEHADLGKHAAIAPMFAGVALIIAVVGLIAVITHSVRLRTKEIGVRMAVGAATRDILVMIVSEGMRPVVIGLAGGFVASIAANRLLQSQLVGISFYDPVTMAAAPLVLIAAAMLACHFPARRAAEVSPVVALRLE